MYSPGIGQFRLSLDFQETTISQTQPDAAQRRPVFSIARVAALCGLLFGYDTGVISGALLFLAQQFKLDHLSQELVASSALVGCIFSPGSLRPRGGG